MSEEYENNNSGSAEQEREQSPEERRSSGRASRGSRSARRSTRKRRSVQRAPSPEPEKDYHFSAPSQPAVVIDVGSGFCKAGIAGDEAPQLVFPSVVASIRHGQAPVILGATDKRRYIGDDAEAKRGILHMRYPVKQGVIRDWEGVCELWDYVFDELGVDSADQCVLLSDPPSNPKKNRQKTCEFMFEQFNVPGLFFQVQAVLSLYASGRTSGVVCDVGDGVTHTIPVSDGWALPFAINRLNLGGANLTRYLMKLLYEEGHQFVSTSNREIVRMMKEEVAYCAVDWKSELEKSLRDEESFIKQYELPDGHLVNLGSIRFKCAEPLFKPWMIGIESRGIHELTLQTIEDCDLDLRRNLFENIIMCGGGSAFTGADERFQREMNDITAGWNLTPNVVAPPERKYSTWIGGSILAALPTFDNMWISKAEFEDVGSNVVVRKCFGVNDGLE